MVYQKYIYLKEKVSLEGETYEAMYPEKHSRVKGLIFRTVDKNNYNGWGAIPWVHTKCFVLWKGKKNWEKIFDGHPSEFNLGNFNAKNGGYFPLLFELESEKIRDNYLRKQEIKTIKREIKQKTGRLENLIENK